MEKKLFTAGEIAKISGVSVRTIRFYDSKGILKPIQYSESNYRYYDEKSLEKLQKILMLKFLGFTLEQIEEVMQKDVGEKSIDNLKNSLSMQKVLLKDKKEHLESLIDAVEIAEETDGDAIWDKLVDIIQITTNKEKIAKQYKNDNNLQRRINIHAYSTAEIPWMQWVYERMNIKSSMKILEIGCGNGLLWHSIIKLLPENLDIYLTDYSEGMLEKAKEAINQHQDYIREKKIHFRFAVKDAEELEIEDVGYDMIIANHMLYHVNQKQELFRRIKELLKEDGKFCCTTVGDTHMLELHDMVEEFEKNIEIPFNWLTGNFRLENGGDQLKQVFSQVNREDQENDLIVDDIDSIYNYVYSYPGNAASILDKIGYKFRERIAQMVQKEGAMFIHKSTGIFICKV